MACNWPHMPPACGCPVSTLHDTITLVDEGAELLAAHPEPATIDFDTRLMLAGIAIDVALSAHGTVEASEAVTESLSAAAAPATHVAEVTQEPEWNPNPTLQAAAGVIRRRGWAQNNFVSNRGEVCLLTAIRIAADDNDAYIAGAEVTLMQRIRATGDTSSSVPKWNDVTGRTIDEILRILG